MTVDVNTAVWKPTLGKATLGLAARLAQGHKSATEWRVEAPVDKEAPAPLKHQLFDSLAAASTSIGQLSMHLQPEWRANLLAQLRSMLSIESWDDDSNLLDAVSVRSFLRFVIYGGIQRVPQIGINNSRELTATWILGDRRVYMDFGVRDACRAVLSSQGKFGLMRQAFAGNVGDAVTILATNGFDLTTPS
jgi:hypothetical protein